MREIDLLLDVNQDCIRDGVRESPSLCPIAKAVEKALLEKGIHAYDITVDGDIIADDMGWYSPTQEERKTVSDFIRNFDNANRVEPFKLLIHLRAIDREEDEDENY